MAGRFRLIQPILKIMVSFFYGFVEALRSQVLLRVFGFADDACTDRNLNSYLIANCVSCIQKISEIFSVNLIVFRISILVAVRQGP